MVHRSLREQKKKETGEREVENVQESICYQARLPSAILTDVELYFRSNVWRINFTFAKIIL